MDRPVRGLERARIATGDATGPELAVARIGGRLAPEVLRDAVLDVVERHPALRCRLVGDRWQTLPAHPARLPFHVRAAPPILGDRRAPWERIAESELRWPLDLAAGMPLRVVQVPEPGGSAILLAAHPAVADGPSLDRVMHEVLVAASARLEGRRAALPEVTPPVPAPDAVRVPPPARWASPLLRRLYASDVRAQQESPALPVEAFGPVRSVCAFRRGSKAGLRRLLAAADEHGVTVEEVALAAAAFAVARHRAERGEAPLAQLPLDVVAELPRPDEGVGLFDGLVRVRVELGGTFWDAALGAGRQVRTLAAWNLHAANAIAFDGLDPGPLLDEAGCDPVFPGTPPAVSATGGYPFPLDHGPLVLRDRFGCAGTAPRGVPLTLGVRVLPDGLCVSAVAAAPSVSRATLDRVVDCAMAWFEEPPAVDFGLVPVRVRQTG